MSQNIDAARDCITPGQTVMTDVVSIAWNPKIVSDSNGGIRDRSCDSTPRDQSGEVPDIDRYIGRLWMRKLLKGRLRRSRQPQR